MTERVLLLDGHSLAYRAFYALPVENFTTTTGQATNAVYGFTSMLINVLRDEQPTRVVVAFDVSRKTFRSERYSEYKATRSSSPPEFGPQVPLIKEVLKALRIPTVEADGFEADDIIATLTGQAVAAGDEVAIVTGDRDAFQLVSPHVTVLYPRKGVSDLARMTPQAVEEKYGLRPDQYPDFAALRGDPSDNLPGIPGVGEKTAGKWIREYGSLAELADKVSEVTGKAGDALRAALPQVLVNRELTTLRPDVPVGLELDAAGFVGWDQAEVDELFDVLQFRALRERLVAQNPAAGAAAMDTEPSDAAEIAYEVITPAKTAAFLASLTPPVAFDTVGEWGRGTGTLAKVTVADAKMCGVIDLSDAKARTALLAWLADASVTKAAHDVKGPMLAAMAAGSAIRGVAIDTAIAAYIASPGQRSFALADVAQRELRRTIGESASEETLFDDPTAADALSAERAITVRDLAGVLEAKLERDAATPLLRDIEMPLIDVLARMERDGIAVDVVGLQALSSEFGSAMRAAEEESFAIVGAPFNLASPKQLGEILFGKFDMPKTKKTKTGAYTTDAEALQWLYESTAHPLIEQLLIWRDRSKLRQTVEGLIPLADADGRIHTTFNQTVAATGRLSSADPNLQNIPIRTEMGRRIRGCFVVGSGFESLMTADYSQIEMRIMAHASEDAGLIEAFRSGEDLHTTVASRVFDVEPTDVDPEMRRRIKAMSYGLAYGLSSFGLSQQLGITPAEASALMDEYFARFGGVRDYLADVVEEARKRGFTETMFGRRRYLPDLTSDIRQRREMAERMALNAPIQGTAADIVKLAMQRVDERLGAAGMTSRLLLQVHDELVLEVAPGEQEALETLVREAMAAAADLSVPLDVSIGVGPSWDAAAH